MKQNIDGNLRNVDNLLVASACKIKTAHFKDELSGIFSLFHVKTLDLLKERLVEIQPEMLLLDFNLPLLNGGRDVSELRKLSPETKIVVFHDSASDEDEWAMFKAGVRGCCPAGIDSSSLKQMVSAVSTGELWIRRKFLHRLLDQLVETQGKERAKDAKFHADFRGLLDQLTRREHEIAVRVASGESNKQIAYSLAITERTVKAHLTNVFDKLGVSDRLNLALIMAAEQRQKLSVPVVSKTPKHTYLATPVIQL